MDWDWGWGVVIWTMEHHHEKEQQEKKPMWAEADATCSHPLLLPLLPSACHRPHPRTLPFPPAPPPSPGPLPRPASAQVRARTSMLHDLQPVQRLPQPLRPLCLLPLQLGGDMPRRPKQAMGVQLPGRGETPPLAGRSGVRPWTPGTKRRRISGEMKPRHRRQQQQQPLLLLSSCTRLPTQARRRTGPMLP